MQVADANPLGIGAFGPEIPDIDLGLEDGIKGEFDFNLSTEMVADSNFYLEEEDEDSQLSFVVTPQVSYTSDPEGGAPISLDLNYNPRVSMFFTDSDLNAFDQSGDFTLTLAGGRTDAALFGRYLMSSGTDELTGEYIEGSVFTGGIRAARQIASRTSLNAGWTAAMSDYGNSTSEGSTVYSTFFGGMWDASERLTLGATFNYTLSESDIFESQDAFALLMEVRYRMGQRIWLSASLGPEFSDDDVRLTGNMNAGYMINERWSWANFLRAATIPAPDQSNSTLYDIRLGTSLQRQLLRGVVTGGVDFGLAQYEEVGSGSASRDDDTNLGVFVNYERPLVSDRLYFDSTVRYSTNDGLVDWDRWLLTAGLNVAF